MGPMQLIMEVLVICYPTQPNIKHLSCNKQPLKGCVNTNRVKISLLCLFNQNYTTTNFTNNIQLFRERLSKKKNIKLYATRPKGSLGIHWNFAYWPKGNLQVCFFARGKFVFPLRGLYL